MRKIFIILFLAAQSLFASGPEVSGLRMMLESSKTSSTMANAFFNQTKNYDQESNALLLGFRAMSNLMLCNHVKNVMTKLSYFKEGKKLLEAAIKKDPENPELIYFRFTTQSNAPSFLGYTENIKTDRKFLYSYLIDHYSSSSADKTLLLKIKNYLVECGQCSKEENEKLIALN